MDFNSLISPFLGFRVILKNLTDFHETVETGMDPCLRMPFIVLLAEKTCFEMYIKFISCRFATKWMSRRERLEQLGNQPKKFTNVYVKNFGEEMTEADFRELVDSFGKVLSLKVVTSDQGRSKGFGFVSFETPEEAQQVGRQLKFNILSAFNFYY